MELLTVQETARLLRVSAVTVRRYIRAGRLAAVHIGRNVRIERESVENLPTVQAVVDSNEGFLSADNPVWKLIGVVADEHGPGDLSENKQKYLAEAYSDLYGEENALGESLAVGAKYFSKRDVLWKMMGVVKDDDSPSDLSSNKKKYMPEPRP